jgi:hypothetical protein
MAKAKSPTQAPVPRNPVNPVLQDAMQRVAIAGRKIMFAPQTRNLLQQGLLSGGPPADILATQIAGILKVADDKSGMNIPKQVLVPAGLVLMRDLVRFVEQARLFKITAADLKLAIQKMIVLLIREYQLYDQQVAKARMAQAGRAAQAAQMPPTPRVAPAGGPSRDFAMAAPAVPSSPPSRVGILAQAGAR